MPAQRQRFWDIERERIAMPAQRQRFWDASVIQRISMQPFETVLEQHRKAVEALAREVSKGHGGRGRLDELCASGYYGLWQAYRAYDEGQNSHFWGFARRRVLGQMLDDVRNESHLSRVGMDYVQSETTDRIPWGMFYRSNVDALQHLASSDNPEESVSHSELRFLLREALSKLEDTPQYLLRRLILDGASRAEVSKEFGFTEVRLGQLLLDAMKQLVVVLPSVMEAKFPVKWRSEYGKVLWLNGGFRTIVECSKMTGVPAEVIVRSVSL
jgi:RNA polymerase sigma factor (sigma-70 family)